MYGVGISYDGWGGYPETIDGIGEVGPIVYDPDTGDVGSGSAGTYYPRDTADDARALNYLGFMSDAELAAHVGTYGSQAEDMNASQGGWDPVFREAVTAFQGTRPSLGTPDGWIGPATRGALGEAVLEKNNGNYPPPPNPNPAPPPPAPGPLPNPPPIPNPNPPPPNPAPAPAANNTVRNVLLGVAGLVVLGVVGYVALD